MSLPDPDFIDRDPVAITAAAIADYEAATGKTLYPAQVETLLINNLSYRETLCRIGIQEAGKQNLVNFARWPMLDYLGGLVACPRLAGESDDAYRARIKIARERAACGSRMAFRYDVASVDASITDVGVTSDADGQVTISALTAAGPAAPSLLDAIREQVAREDLSPMTDQILVVAPARIGYLLDVRLILLKGTAPGPIQATAVAALQAYATARRATLGRDLVISQITEPVQAIAGVYSVRVASPAPRVVGPHEWADCEDVLVSVEGYVDG